MAKVTDYKNWLSGVDLENHENVYQLYNSVSNFEGSGIFYTSKEITNTGNIYHVKAEGSEDTLLLENDENRFEFLDFLSSEYTDAEDKDIEKWYKLKEEIGRVD
ncbi:hypothetical protein ACFP1I_07585 [Dyadobacter subterraneus]|uniref:Uncharacterized protein n=1 Tax=Dyadobacter subterraneus TaxID=2773304 RepID=A0ABR9WET6_9BACT|nr:hypothetical protein [Dyadobacter subterraneus]MBE9464006.1 hypothetical protein [Dyadobacter subterraneus]